MKTRKVFYYILAFWLILVMAFGMWWLYLLQELGSQLDILSLSSLEYPRLIRMIRLEGSSFIFVLFSGGIFAGWVYLQDLKKSRAIQAFFSSLTHELKTPLASMRLQAEVIDSIVSEKKTVEKLPVLIERLLEDSRNLEVQMDKALQLARLEQGGNFHQEKINLNDFFTQKLTDYKEQFKVELNIDSEYVVLGDEFALELVIKNFFENTKRHQPESRSVSIKTTFEHNKVILSYDDMGAPFKGDLNKLGTLFYKHNSSQGTGVGLYLSQRLATAMKGKLHIQAKPNLSFHLHLTRVNE